MRAAQREWREVHSNRDLTFRGFLLSGARASRCLQQRTRTDADVFEVQIKATPPPPAPESRSTEFGELRHLKWEEDRKCALYRWRGHVDARTRTEAAGALVAQVLPRSRARARVRNHASFSSFIFPPSPSVKLYSSSACQPRPAPLQLHPKSRFGKQYVSFVRDGALEIDSVLRSSSSPRHVEGGEQDSHT